MSSSVSQIKKQNTKQKTLHICNM